MATDRFPIKIGSLLALPLRIIKVKPEKAWVELREQSLYIEFGYVFAEVPYANVESVDVDAWSWIFGYGLRIATKKTVGYVSARGPVAYLQLKEPQSVKVGPGSFSFEAARLAISLVDPAAFRDALRTRLS